jgi:hypothetical protein
MKSGFLKERVGEQSSSGQLMIFLRFDVECRLCEVHQTADSENHKQEGLSVWQERIIDRSGLEELREYLFVKRL